MADSPRQAAVAPRGAEFDPARFETFRFTGFDFDRSRLTASLRYALDDEVEFTERVRFPGATPPSPGASADALESLLSLLHLVAGVSYYKAAAPPAITVESGAAIDASTSEFLERLYVDGLSEFGWVNGIDLRERVRFAPNTRLAGVVEPPALERRTARADRRRQGLGRGPGGAARRRRAAGRVLGGPARAHPPHRGGRRGPSRGRRARAGARAAGAERARRVERPRAR